MGGVGGVGVGGGGADLGDKNWRIFDIFSSGTFLGGLI